jgi:hypothetical protein
MTQMVIGFLFYLNLSPLWLEGKIQNYSVKERLLDN